MYRRRQTRRTYSRRTSFRRRGTKAPTRAGAQRWQWGNIFASTTFQATAGECTNVLFELASMELNHFSDPNLPDNAGLIAGGVMAQMVKGIDIGGIVFSSGIHNTDSQVQQAPGLLASRFFQMHTVTLDKKDPQTGVPNGANAAFDVSTFPANVVDFTLPRPGTDTEIRDYPSRILYRSANYQNSLSRLLTDVTFAEDTLHTVPRNEIYSGERHRSLRIRRRLTDDWGLYYGAHVWTTGAVAESQTFTAWFSGSIYFRVVF